VYFLHVRAKKYTSLLRVYFLSMLQQQPAHHRMTEQVHLPDASFAHNCLHLAPPNGLQGGAYFSMLYYKDAPLYIQTPKCTSRQAVVPGKRPYIDLMFSSHDAAFLEWLEALEADAIRMIYEKRNVWINGDIEKSDIEAGFTSPVRPYKGGKNYLIRANIQPSKHLAGTPSCSVFDENERPVSIEHIKAENQMYTVLEFQGIKFTSRSFQFEVALKQVLLVSNVPMFQSCVIRKPSSAARTEQNQIPHQDPHLGKEQQPVEEPGQEEPKQQQPVEEQEDQNQEDQTQEDQNQEDQNQKQEDQKQEDQKQEDQKQEEPNQNQTQDQGQEEQTPEKPIVQEMQEVNLDVLEELEQMHLKLKKPTEVYYKMYQVAKQKAKELKKNAIAAYLEAKQIKSTHMLEDSDDSDDSDIYSDSDNDNDNDNNDS
jgi:hypothetical protein